MPGPFPGMDPYLEHPHLWQGVHNKLITHIEETLNSLLPPGYLANVEAHRYVIPAQQLMGKTYIRPDVVITRPSEHNRASSGGTAVLDETVGSYIIEPLPLEINEAYVDILDAEDQSRIITTIELLSYTNKNAGDKGRGLYHRKQKTLLESHTHLLEIDLLRD